MPVGIFGLFRMRAAHHKDRAWASCVLASLKAICLEFLAPYLFRKLHHSTIANQIAQLTYRVFLFIVAHFRSPFVTV